MSTASQGLPTVAVAVKSVPVGGAFLRVVDGALTRVGLAHGLDPINEVAVEWAVAAREAGHVGRVVAVCMGPTDGDDAIRRALAMGCDEALLVSDPALAGADVPTTAHVLAAALGRVGADIAVFGYESLDGSSGTVPAAVAAVLDRPLLSFARSASVVDGAVRIERDAGRGPEALEADLPVVLTIVAGGIDPRFPKLKDLLAARKVELDTVSLAHLDASSLVRAGERVLRLVDVPATTKDRRVVPADDGVDIVVALLEERGVLGASGG